MITQKIAHYIIRFIPGRTFSLCVSFYLLVVLVPGESTNQRAAYFLYPRPQQFSKHN
jgi:hypothetical protein